MPRLILVPVLSCPPYELSICCSLSLIHDLMTRPPPFRYHCSQGYHWSFPSFLCAILLSRYERYSISLTTALSADAVVTSFRWFLTMPPQHTWGSFIRLPIYLPTYLMEVGGNNKMIKFDIWIGNAFFMKIFWLELHTMAQGIFRNDKKGYSKVKKWPITVL